MKEKIKPFVTPIILTIVSLIFLIELSGSAEPDSIGLMFPKILTILLLICSVGLGVREFIKAKKSSEKQESSGVKLYLPLLICFVAYIFSLLIFGFFISTPIFLYICSKIFKISTTKSIILAAAMTLVIYLLFVQLLFVPFPSGVWIFKSLNEFIIY